jgi:hypothetical protein
VLREISNLVTSELRLRKLSIHGYLEDQQTRLRDALKVELQKELVTQAISRGEEGKDAALLLISQAVPCAMHLENRAGEKIITVLFSNCLSLSSSPSRLLLSYPAIYCHISTYDCLKLIKSFLLVYYFKKKGLYIMNYGHISSRVRKCLSDFA